jgi:hypothetical protein
VTRAKASHTPGPWHVLPDDPEHGRPARIGAICCHVDGVRCWILSDDSIDGIDEDDARLIAAAPDLLAACTKVLASLASDEGATRADMDLLRAVTAKATGEAS